jgi:hypothetical protein
MGSGSRDVRLRQKELAEKQLEARLAALASRGLGKKVIDRDPGVRKLRASIRKTGKQLAAIDAREALARELVELRAAKAAAPKEPKKKGGKKAAEAAAAGEGKKKKEKKEKKEKEEAPKEE